MVYELAGDRREHSERTIDAWFRDAQPRAIAGVAAAARSELRYSPWSGHVRLHAPLEGALLDAFAPPCRLAIAALLSLHRNGYVRELGLRRLARSADARVVPFLLLRADDVVSGIRAIAESAVCARLTPELARAFARSLGLVELLAARARGGGGPLVRSIRDFLARPAHQGALVEASRDDDPAVRRAAFVLRLRTEPASYVLRAALLDPDTRIRRFAARTVVSRTPSREDKLALLPLLEAARAPSTRILALRGWHSIDSSDAHLEAALLDHNAAVRQLARSMLRARHPQRPFGETRQQALRVLGDSGARAREIVGALGALADVGLRSDLDEVRRFVEDPRSRVRVEARRTMEWLER